MRRWRYDCCDGALCDSWKELTEELCEKCLIRTQGFTEEEMDKLAVGPAVTPPALLAVLYLGSVELLICGSCAVTAAAMYQRKAYQLEHPENAPPKRYVKAGHSRWGCGAATEAIGSDGMAGHFFTKMS
eukprot:Skav234588  [mRNA]  locus=scaffold313:404027:406765:- [translate_table: standard]